MAFASCADGCEIASPAKRPPSAGGAEQGGFRIFGPAARARTAARRGRVEPAGVRDQRLDSRCGHGDHGDEGLARGPAQSGGQRADVFDGVVGAEEGGDHDENARGEEHAEERFLADGDARFEYEWERDAHYSYIGSGVVSVVERMWFGGMGRTRC